MKSYKDLAVYQESLRLFFLVHRLSLRLPKYELYELGSQLRRSSDSIVSNIVEGYGRRAYKKDFIRFLTYSHASCLETIAHITKIMELYPEFKEELVAVSENYDVLSAKIFRFIAYVKTSWRV